MSFSSKWAPAASNALVKLMDEGAGRRLPVVFDFDNTIVCGDIGEATFAVLVRDGVLEAEQIPATISPSFHSAAGREVTVTSGPDLTAYYERFLDPTAHGKADPTPYANSYAWVVEIMAGLTPLQIVQATQRVYSMSRPAHLEAIEVTPGSTAYPAPFFYEEMVEFISELLRKEFEVWIVSASNVWSVRWMVLSALNPRLRALGARDGIAAEHVVGVSTLLQDATGRLYKDCVLVKEQSSYAALSADVLGTFRLTSKLQHPVPTYGGKVACIWEQIGRRPYLSAGDSPGDLPMLTFSENRLWISRVEKPAYNERAIAAMAVTGQAGWIVQPVRSKGAPGFLPSSN